MAALTSSVGLNLTTVSSEYTTIPKSASTGEPNTLNPFAVGLILEAGILAVVFGNLLVLISLRFLKDWLVTDVLLLSLSTADFVDGTLPLQLIIFMNYFIQQKWTAFLCDLYIIVVNSLRFASAGTVTLIAVERAFMILSPLKYHTKVTVSRIKKAVVITWLIAVFFAILPFIGVGTSGYEEGKCFYHLTDMGRAYAILILSASFLLLTIVSACCIAIKSSSSRFISRQTQMDNKNKRAGNRTQRDSTCEILECERVKIRRKSNPSGVREIRRLSRMMALVILLYCVSWLPILISNIVTMVTDRKSSKLVVLLTGMVSLVYATANPIIYGTMSMRYRWAYRRVFNAACCFCGRRPRSWSLSFSSISTPRSRTFTIPQLFSDQSSEEHKIKEAARKQKTEQEQKQATQTALEQNCHETVVSDDVTDRPIPDVPPGQHMKH